MTVRDNRFVRGVATLSVDSYHFRDRAVELIRRGQLGSYEWRVEVGAVDRPAYAYCVRGAAKLAHRLGLERISVVEFGVAGGDGLLALEHHARQWSDRYGVDIEVYGFDTGEGLPASDDYRDLPYHWGGGTFKMDVGRLQRHLHTAKLVLGDIRETIDSFVDLHDPAPVGAAMYDMDFYSSTAAGLRLFDLDEKYRLPRVLLYFDDIVGNDISLYSDYTGERLAIAEFNDRHPMLKISPVYSLACRSSMQWHHEVFAAHDFTHPQYGQFVSGPWGDPSPGGP